MKPIKERIKIYLLILAFGLVAILGLLVTGYDYTRARGFFLSEKREAMNLSEALIALPKEYIWTVIACLFIICVVELFIFITIFIKNKYSE